MFDYGWLAQEGCGTVRLLFPVHWGSEGSSPVQHVREGQSQYTNIKVPDLRLAWVCSEKGDVSSTELLLLRNVIVWRLDSSGD